MTSIIANASSYAGYGGGGSELAQTGGSTPEVLLFGLGLLALGIALALMLRWSRGAR